MARKMLWRGKCCGEENVVAWKRNELLLKVILNDRLLATWVLFSCIHENYLPKKRFLTFSLVYKIARCIHMALFRKETTFQLFLLKLHNENLKANFCKSNLFSLFVNLAEVIENCSKNHQIKTTWCSHECHVCLNFSKLTWSPRLILW